MRKESAIQRLPGGLTNIFQGRWCSTLNRDYASRYTARWCIFFGSTRKTETGEYFAVLVTVIYIPNNLKNSALGLQKRKKGNNSDVAGE